MAETESAQTADHLTCSIRLFARARDLAETNVIEVVVPQPATVADVRRAMASQYPQLAPISGALLVAVNAAYAADADLLPPGAEVACFPPVSGG